MARKPGAAIPADAVVLAMQHSGSVRYYAGRLTMRWHAIDPPAIDAAAAPTEPIARSTGDVRLYALDAAGGQRTTAAMPRAEDRCVDASPRFVYSDAERRLAGRPPDGRRPFSER